MTGEEIQDELLKLSDVGQKHRIHHATLLASDIRDLMAYVADNAGEASTEDLWDMTKAEVATSYAKSLVHMISKLTHGEMLNRAWLLHARCKAAKSHEEEYESLTALNVQKDVDRAKRIWRKSAQEACDEAHRLLIGLIALGLEKKSG